MDSMLAYANNLAAQERGAEDRVFDWHKAATLIKERKPTMASAGLQGDWEWTGGPIFEDGKPVPRDKTYTYLMSSWAIPELDLDGEVQECWCRPSEHPEWGAETYWPESALALL